MKPLVGTVVSNKLPKTVTVEVVRIKVHPVYKKRVRWGKKYHAHDDFGALPGERVKIKECRPVSKTKKWKVIEIIKNDQLSGARSPKDKRRGKKR
jgi:small subunit ribosomal protein S17